MKKILLAFFAPLLFSMVLGQPVPELIYYNFNGTGTTFPNLASAPPPGTATAMIVGTQSLFSSGICDSSLLGSGGVSTANYVNTGWPTSLATGSWTISFRASFVPSTTTTYYFFGDNTANSIRCFTGGVVGAGNIGMRGTTFVDHYITGAATTAPSMVTWVYDASAGYSYAYLNGVYVNSVLQNLTPNFNGTGPFKVGAYSGSNAIPAGTFMDDFRIYNRALSAAEVMQIFNPGITSSLGADTTLCAGDSLLLSAPSGGSSYLWNDGSVTASIWASVADTFSVTMAGACQSGTDTIILTSPAPLPSPGFAGADTSVTCTTDSTMLSLSGVDSTQSILWSNGATDSVIWIVGGGILTATVTGECGSVVDTVSVAVNPLEYSAFAMSDTTMACTGDTIMLGTIGGFDTYSWSTGDTTASSMAFSSGTYYLTVSDACGSGVDSVTVDFITAPSAGFTHTSLMDTCYFTNTSTGAGTVTYHWDFGDGDTSSVSDPVHGYSASGTYVVVLTVTNECGSSLFTDTCNVIVIGLNGGSNFAFSAFPNPANTELTVSAGFEQGTDLHMSLVSAMGQTAFSRTFTGVSGQFRETIHLNEVASGIYFLYLDANGVRKVTRIVVNH